MHFLSTFVLLLSFLQEPAVLSVDTVVKSPANYDERIVRVRGYYDAGFEHSILTSCKDNDSCYVPSNTIWIESAKTPAKLYNHRGKKVKNVKLEGVLVEITGKLESKWFRHGHMNQWPCQLIPESITVLNEKKAP